MPLNLNALIRFRAINRCLIEKEYVSFNELKKACERALDIYPLGDRTIQGDIGDMRHNQLLGYFAPIEYDKWKQMYFYSDRNYSIDKLPLKEEEINSIFVAAKLLDQFRGVEIFSQFSGSVRKIAEVASIYREYDETTFRNAIDFEKAYETGGTEYISPVIDSIKNKYPLKLTYKSFTSETETHSIVHPYLLKEYRNRWYLVGYSSRYKAIRTYCLDRFRKLEKEERILFHTSSFNPKQYYADVIGISVVNSEPVEIDVAFSELQAQYIITQPLHSSQKRVDDEKDRIVFRYRLVPNFEFLSYIIGLAKEAEVLRPKGIRTKIRKLHEVAGYNYK